MSYYGDKAERTQLIFGTVEYRAVAIPRTDAREA